MAIAPVGSAATFNSGASNIPTTGQSVSVSPTAGNAIVVFSFIRGSTSTTAAVTATGGTATFTSLVAQLGNSTYLHVSIAVNVGAGITAIKVSPNVAARGLIWVREYSGVDNTTPSDVTPTVAGTQATTTTPATVAITPVTNGALVLAGMTATVNMATTPQTMTSSGPTTHSGTQAGSGWTEEYDVWNGQATAADMCIGSNLVNALGSYQADWVLPLTGQTGAATVALRPATPTVANTNSGFFAL